MDRIKKYDKQIAIIFFLLTVCFITLAMTNKTFLNWAYERHQNQISWFIRPIFLIPFCFFAYKRSWTGIAVTILCLLTSMFWFNKPEIISEEVKAFLQFEIDWLGGEWNIQKWLLTLTIPVSFFALGLAFWKRSLFMGLGVVVLMATGKIIWSIQSAGEAGKSILVPAVAGLLVCTGLIYFGFKRLEKNNPNH